MKLFKYWLQVAIAAVGLCASTAHAADCNLCAVPDFDDEIDERDFAAVTEFVNSKRTIDLQEKACNLTLSGDIRTEWEYIQEKQNGEKLRGSGAVDLCNCPLVNGVPTPTNEAVCGKVPSTEWEIEFNLKLDYKCERAWGVAHLQFDNRAGVQRSRKSCGDQPTGEYRPCGFVDRQTLFGSGACDGICLRRAYMGYNVCADGCSRWDIEVGRRRLYDVFDSRVQFLSRFDGILSRYATQWECSDFYWNLGAFVVDNRSKHYAWVTEFGLLNISDCGFDLKYSYIDWEKRGRNRCDFTHPDGARYRISQFTAAYNFDAESICMPAKLYGAFLWNAAAPKRSYTADKKKNIGWYAGVLIGEVCCEGDWSLDINYQWVQAQAVPDTDISGIGRGNLRNEVLTMAAPFNVPSNARGNANYKGWRVEALYALTDNLSIDALFMMSRPEDKRIGGSNDYQKFKIEAIYAF